MNRESIRTHFPYIILLLGLYAISLNANLIKVALPFFMEEFQIDTTRLIWVTISYTFFQAGFTPVLGKLGDAWRHDRVILAGYIIFLVGSLVGGSASTFYGILLGRSIQGIGAAAVLPNAVISATSMFPHERRGRAMGLLAGVAASAALMGPAIGGLLMEVSDWRLLFLANIPIMVLVFFLSFPSSRKGKADSNEKHLAEDIKRAASLSVILGCWIILLNAGALLGWASPYFLALLAGFSGLVLVFYLREKRCEDHFIDINLFLNRYFRAGFFSGCINFAVVFGTAFVLPLLLAIEYGMSPGRIGLALALANVARFITAPLSGSFTDTYGNRMPVRIGFILLFMAMVTLYSPLRNQFDGLLYISMALIGGGSGFVSSPTFNAVQENSPEDSQGAIMGFFTSIRYISGMMGQIVLGVLLKPLREGIPVDQSSPLFDRAFGFIILLVVAGYWLSTTLPDRSRKTREEEARGV